MTFKKRITAIVLLLTIIIGLFSSCKTDEQDNKDNTITINMWASGVDQIASALEKKFPEINFVFNEYSGANNSLYHKKLLQRGEGGDIFLYTTFYNDTDAPKYLVDLSGYPFLANFDKAILSTLDVGGAIYQIPGPISVRYLAVNKTLFDDRGWKIPENFDELVDVCNQIHEEAPDIVPLGLGSEGMGFVWTQVTSYSQMGYLDTAEGSEAEQSFREGNSSFGDAFGEGLDMVCQLIDAGAFLPNKFSDVWDVSPKHMGDRQAAMCYVMSSNALHSKLFSGQAKGDEEFGKYNDDEFVVLPLYGKNSKNKGLILGTTNTWGINKRLEAVENEKKLENALRILEYISTEEGQLAIRSDPATIPANKNLIAEDIPEFMKNLWNDNTNSIKTFFLYTGYEHIMVETGQILANAMYKGDSTGVKQEFIRVADTLNHEFLNGESSSAAFGYAEDDISVEQTRKISCEAFQRTAKADFAIVSESGIKNGAVNKNGLAGRLFKGDIVSESINVIIAAINVNVVSVSLTGSEIRQMLENGKPVPNADGVNEVFKYWSSGLDITNEDGEITKITVNGSELDESASYKVAMLEKDYSDGFEENHKIVDTGVSITESLGGYFSQQGVIKAEN